MRSFATLTLAALLLVVDARAQETADRGVVRRDPKGITGVSPVWEAVAKGDALIASRDLDGAMAAYREAISKDAKHPLGHYRAGQIFLLKGDLPQAEAAYTTALRFADSDHSLKARLLFCLADLKERQKATDAAIAAWAEYQAHAGTDEKLKILSASAAERKKRNEAWKKLGADSAEVKARIEKRLKEDKTPR